MHDDAENNPMQHPEEQPSGADGNPKFGRLLLVLAFAVLLVVLLTFGSEAYYMH
ncbi:MAG TPA: hypothetical protein VL528_08415 [Oxalicibacterium sp.]|jgi:hypothetical protein|nr:hypothetical protein [Oxalicibacterium sp.]